MKKISAVNWLEQEFVKLEKTVGVHGIMYELIEKSREMEKQNIIDAVNAGFHDGSAFIEDIKYSSGEDYYNQTYKQ